MATDGGLVDLSSQIAYLRGDIDWGEAAAALAFRVARARDFTAASKRTGVLLARGVLDRNGVQGAAILLPDDLQFAELLVKAASGLDVEDQAVALLDRRRSTSG